MEAGRADAGTVQLRRAARGRAGAGVEPVDVLRDEPAALAHPPRDEAVRDVGLGGSELACKPEAAAPVLEADRLVGEEVRELDRFNPAPNATGGTEIVDAGRRGDARAGEEHGRPGR